MAERNLAIRLSVMDGGKVKAELKEIGESGEKSLKKIELAGKPASKSLIALNAAANDVKGVAVGLTSQIGPLGSAMAALGPIGLAAGAAFGVLTLGLTASAKEAAAAEQAQNRLQGVLKATGYASGLTGKDIAEMAEDMEHSTLTSAEAVKGAAAVLATFRSVSGDTFKQAIHLAQDMSAVFGQDLSSSATQLGKALEDPVEGISALKRVGVSFSDSQRDVIAKLVETGEKAEAQRLILAALEQQVGGAAAAETQGLTGAAHRLSVAWGDMLKAIGQTETVSGTAQAALNKLASTFAITAEWFTDAPLATRLREAKDELAEIEKSLDWLRSLPSYLQPLYKNNTDVRVKKAEELRRKIEELTQAEQKEADERKKADDGRTAAEKQGVADLISQKIKVFDEGLAKLADNDAEQKIAKINKELESTARLLENLRAADGSNAPHIGEALQKAQDYAKVQIAAIEKPIAEAARKEASANQKIIDDLKQKLLGIGNERQAFIDQAVSRLSEKATDGQRQQTKTLASQLFDENAFASVQKIIGNLTDEMNVLGQTARQNSIREALADLPETASDAQVQRVRELAAALYDQKEAQEKLDKLKEEGKQLTESSKSATEAYADKIARLNDLLNAGAISQSTYNKALAGADKDLLSSRTDPEAGILRAFNSYKESAGNTATAIEQAFSEAMKGTEDAIVNMVTSGEISLNSLNDIANSVVHDITRMLVQQSITTPLFKYLTNSATSDGGWINSLMGAIFHDGGEVGGASPSRQVPAYVFAGAPRYHGGGIAGLKPDEVPAILQRGEEVVSKNDRERRSAGVNIVMHISTPDANSFRASQGQIAAKAARGINRARRNL